MVAMDLWQNSHVFKKNGKFIFLGPPGPLAVALSVCKSVTLIPIRLRYTVYLNTKSSTSLQIYSTEAH